MFKVGQKVVCVNDTMDRSISVIQKNRVYTVKEDSSVFDCSVHTYIKLKEVVGLYYIKRFIPLEGELVMSLYGDDHDIY